MKKILFAASAFVLFARCNGGPCEYKDFPLKTTIVSIEKDTLQPYPNYADKDSTYKVKLATSLEGHDTLELSDMLKRNITGDFLREHHLSEGTTLKGVANLRISGSCAPGSYRFNDTTLHR